MSPWLTDGDKNGLLKLIENRSAHPAAAREEILRVKMTLDAIDAQTKAALADERAAAANEMAVMASLKYAKYLLWAAAAAAFSATAPLAAAIIVVFR